LGVLNLNALAKPLGALLKLIFDLTNNYGLSIILFTVVVKLLTIPLTLKQTRSVREINEIQPELKKLQEKYKNDKEQLNVKILELYKKHKISPFGGCLPLLIQIPILVGLFAALREPAKYVFESEAVYKTIDTGFLWLSNLAKPDPFLWGLPLLAGLTTYLSSATMSTGAPTDQNQKIMTYFMPIMIFWWGIKLPAGLTLYWVISNVFQTVQQLAIRGPRVKLKEE
jgi:YidC/Oxa1 family membrane protein insertase